MISIPTHLRLHSQSLALRKLIHHHFKQLFLACELEGEFLWGDAFSKDINSDSASSEDQGLYGFMMEARIFLDEHLQKRKANEQQLYSSHTKLRLHRIRTIFEGPRGEPMNIHTQIDCVHRLERVIDHLGETLAKNRCQPFVVVFSDGTEQCHVDHRGRLVLSYLKDEHDWMSFLQNQSTLQQANLRHQAWQAVKEFENKVSTELGVFQIFSEPQLLTDTSYLSFLERLLENKHIFHSLLQQRPQLTQVSIRVHRLGVYPKYHIDKDLGVMIVPVDCQPDRLRMFIEKAGEQAVYISNKHQNDTTIYHDTVLRIKRKLAVRSLECDASVSPQHMLQCCRRLLTVPPQIGNLMDGVDILVCDQFAYDESGVIRIRWDFAF